MKPIRNLEPYIVLLGTRLHVSADTPPKHVQRFGPEWSVLKSICAKVKDNCTFQHQLSEDTDKNWTFWAKSLYMFPLYVLTDTPPKHVQRFGPDCPECPVLICIFTTPTIQSCSQSLESDGRQSVLLLLQTKLPSFYIPPSFKAMSSTTQQSASGRTAISSDSPIIRCPVPEERMKKRIRRSNLFQSSSRNRTLWFVCVCVYLYFCFL